jgi:sulfide:quinone oxidoreductase
MLLDTLFWGRGGVLLVLLRHAGRSFIRMNIHKLSDQLLARALVRISDLGAIHAASFRSIISNRPDAEDLGQPSSHGTRAAAQAHGLEARHQPIVPGSISEGEVAAFQGAHQRTAESSVGLLPHRRAVVIALENDGEMKSARTRAVL